MMGLYVILFSANYCNVQTHLPLARSSHPTLRVIDVVLCDIVIAFFFVIVLSVLEPLLSEAMSHIIPKQNNPGTAVTFVTTVPGCCYLFGLC
ncbi:MAG: hypothetical protein LIO95_00900 [Clostridiales bacterium]|nr:hypothetical protein [Clostridiales bacterium]